MVRKGDGTGLGAEGYSQVRKGDGTVLWNAIPDGDVYLHDDWGDNKLQDRDDSETTTHNGVEGVYRPEWTIQLGDPQAQNQRLVTNGEDALSTGVNLNLDETITWEWTDVDVSVINDDGTDDPYFWAFSETTTFGDLNSPQSSYMLRLNQTGEWRLLRGDPDGTDTDQNVIISESFGEITSPHDVSLTRDSNGNWEAFRDGISWGTTKDTTYSNPEYIGYSNRTADVEYHVNEMKVF